MQQPHILSYIELRMMGVTFIICCVLLSLSVLQSQGQSVYDPLSEVCCNGVAYPRQGFFYPQCCGNATFDYHTQLCCNGVVQNKVGTNSICCGEKAVENAANFTCCGGQMLPVVGNRFSSLCCGNQIYNNTRRQLICCNNVLHNASYDSRSCCGNSTYNLKSQTCCNGEVVNRPRLFWQRYDCCGDKFIWYDQLCCNGTVFNSSSQRWNPFTSRESYCCGSTIVQDPSKELCCRVRGVVIAGNHTWQGCCGSTAYNVSSQICCDSTLYSVSRNSYRKCCGSQLFDPFSRFAARESFSIGHRPCCNAATLITTTISSLLH